ncbi:MAG: ArsR/SmtB family transcription factor [Actinomycetes bacterium]
MTTRPEPPPHGPIPPGAPLGPWSHRPADDAEARALASGLRLQVLRLTLREPLTNKEIADRLGRNPASVLHHVRTLLASGFLVAAGERRGARGAREVPYRATGKSWYLTTDVGNRGVLDAFLAEVARVDVRDLQMWRLGLRLNEASRRELAARFQRLLAEYSERPRDEDGDDWSVFLAFHPESRPGAAVSS